MNFKLIKTFLFLLFKYVKWWNVSKWIISLKKKKWKKFRLNSGSHRHDKKKTIYRKWKWSEKIKENKWTATRKKANIARAYLFFILRLSLTVSSHRSKTTKRSNAVYMLIFCFQWARIYLFLMVFLPNVLVRFIIKEQLNGFFLWIERQREVNTPTHTLLFDSNIK